MEISNDIAQVALPHAETRHAGSAERMSNTTRTDCPGEQVFAQALCDDSNQELDWLWAHVQVTHESERRYCLERALAINPKSELALAELARLHSGTPSQHGDRL